LPDGFRPGILNLPGPSFMLLFDVNPTTEHELYLKLFITCGGGL
jgi:hypothetical protein